MFKTSGNYLFQNNNDTIFGGHLRATKIVRVENST
jgi:hypothetical protein